MLYLLELSYLRVSWVSQECLDALFVDSAQEMGIADCMPNDRRPECQPIDPRHPERFYLPPSGFSPGSNDNHIISLKIPAGDNDNRACRPCAPRNLAVKGGMLGIVTHRVTQ